MADFSASYSGVYAGKKAAGLIHSLPTQPTLDQPDLTIGEETCQISELKVHSKRNAFSLDAAAKAKLQKIAVPVQLKTGTHIIKISDNEFRDQDSGAGEPLVMLWLDGGKVINQKTGTAVISTWSTLNGYDDMLTLEVLEPTMLYVFFLDTDLRDDEGKVQLSIVRI